MDPVVRSQRGAAPGPGVVLAPEPQARGQGSVLSSPAALPARPGQCWAAGGQCSAGRPASGGPLPLTRILYPSSLHTFTACCDVPAAAVTRAGSPCPRGDSGGGARTFRARRYCFHMPGSVQEFDLPYLVNPHDPLGGGCCYNPQLKDAEAGAEGTRHRPHVSPEPR